MCIRDRFDIVQAAFFVKNSIKSFTKGSIHIVAVNCNYKRKSEYICLEQDGHFFIGPNNGCLLYTSDAADERSSVDLGGRRIIKKKKT